MIKAVFKSTRTIFNRKNMAFQDMMLGTMAIDIERGIKITAGTPVKTGGMKAATRVSVQGAGKYRVETNKEYAAVQEAGRRRGGRPFSNYTTPGTSAGWFRRAINSVVRMKHVYVQETKRALGL